MIDPQSARLGLAAEHPDPYRAAAPTFNADAPCRKCVMCKPYSGPLPAILRRRFKPGRSADDRQAVFKALVERYRPTEKSEEMLPKTKGLVPEDRAGSLFWQTLAQSLMFDFIPAYQPQLSEVTKHILLDWISAGGTVEAFMADDARYHRHFYQAQLVRLIQEQGRQKDRPQAWVFRWFANEVETQGPKEKERRISLLPRPYRGRSTAISLKQAYMSIPRPVRMKPYDYLPVMGLGPAPARLT